MARPDPRTCPGGAACRCPLVALPVREVRTRPVYVVEQWRLRRGGPDEVVRAWRFRDLAELHRFRCEESWRYECLFERIEYERRELIVDEVYLPACSLTPEED